MKGIFSIFLAVMVGLGAARQGAAVGATNSEAAFDCALVTEIPLVECQALVALYNSTGGEGWLEQSNWLTTNTPGDWYGVGVSGGRVTVLALAANGLAGGLPPELGDLDGLVYLVLWSNRINSVPDALGDLSLLQELDLSGNQIPSLPGTIGNLTNLGLLDLSYNQIGALPAEFGQLSHLRRAALSSNQLSSLPGEMGNLSKLEWLYLNDNQISELPPELGQLGSLGRLILSENQLSSLPEEMGGLDGLSYLDLSENQLASLPAWVGDLGNLEQLYLAGNQLSSLPPEAGQLSGLGELDLSNNQLSSLEPWLGGLSALWGLDLAENQISSLPAEIGQLTGLEQLYLQGNQLSSLPPELFQLGELWELDLSYNQLSGDVPAGFTNLSGLIPEGLDLDYNRLNVPDGYPDPNNPLHTFLVQADPDWHLRQSSEETIGPAGGTLTSPDGRVTVSIPAGALGEDVSLSFMPLPASPHPYPGLSFAGISFRLEAVDGNGDPVTTFYLPVKATISYTDEGAALIPNEALFLGYWDEAASGWMDAAQTCDPAGETQLDREANTLQVEFCRLGEFGVFGEGPRRIYVPLVME